MATRRAGKPVTSVHQLKVTLRDIRPPVWRRIAVPSELSLGDLYGVVQEAMGWRHSHLHDFRIGRTVYGDPAFVVDSGDKDEWEARLAAVAPKIGQRFRYVYDFGDNWEHEILVEAVQPPEPGTRYPICLAGARACPPEDCGGVWGYADLLEVMADPDNPERKEMLEWLGGPLDPDAFDLKAVNTRLARMG